MKYVSLFAGIGGFDLALNQLGHECVYVNEWDKYAAQTYEKNFSHKPDTRSITDVPTSEIPDHDILVGGFPCQAFSIAGKRMGFAETRGTLFFEIARILRYKRPRYFLLENVKGLLSHDSGKTFQTILGVLTDIGYEYQWQVLNSKNFGVPQNRERVFIVGHLRGERRPEVFPIRGTNKEADGKMASTTIDSNYWKGIDNHGARTGIIMYPHENNLGGIKIGTLRTHKDGKGFREMKSGLAPTISARAREDGSGQPVVYMYPHGTNPGGFKKLPNLRAHSGAIHNELLVKRLNSSQDGVISDIDKNAPTLSAGHYNQPKIVDKAQIRRLTPTECERLQGFPDGWTEGVSDTQRYKQLGNAVTVNVIREIVKRIFTSS